MIVMVVVMDTCDRIKTIVRADGTRELPLTGGDGRNITVREVVAAVRFVGQRSDMALEALFDGVDPTDASLLVVEALLPMLTRRAAGDGALLDDLIGEVVIVFHELREQGTGRTRARLANYIMDTAWDRCRRARRAERRVVPVDNATFADLLASVEPGPERVAVNRVALAEFGARVQREGAEDPVLQRSWSDVLALSERSRSTPADQDRWKYVRRVLRRYGHPDLVA
jgi:hypothetical protein